MKIVRNVGLSLFLIGFFLFNATFFLNHYQLAPAHIARFVSNSEKADLLNKELTSLFESNISSNFDFVSRLDDTFTHINQSQLTKYSIGEDEIDEIVKANSADSIKFSSSSLSEVFANESETNSYKIKSLQDYGSWMDGRDYGSEEELRGHITNVVNNINKYGIISQKGFDRYEIKDLKYNLTKAASIGPVANHPILFIFLTFGLCMVGALMFILPKIKELLGIKNNGMFHDPMKTAKWLGILTGTYLILFYIVLYYFPQYMTSWVIMVDPISRFIKGSEAGPFFLYGLIYTLCILVMGVRMLIKYRHSKYQVIRTFSVMFFQIAFAFLIPEILLRLNQPYFDFKNIWPLNYSFFFDNNINSLLQSGGLGVFMLGWGIVLVVVAVPVFVYFFGKRWYCSWVCGCGGLAETLGDPYRQLSDKSLKAWKVERWMIHSVLLFAVVMTAGVLYTYFTGTSEVLGVSTYKIRETYGAWIGAGFAGVVGTGFYPLMGNRVWCRFGCPLAAYLGFVQRFKSRFRITTNGGQCISCGNCSTYCEMGIDVRWYAQRGQNIVRSSCVGCGVCSSVCPRGVLNLENRDEESRFVEPISIGDGGLKLR